MKILVVLAFCMAVALAAPPRGERRGGSRTGPQGDGRQGQRPESVAERLRERLQGRRPGQNEDGRQGEGRPEGRRGKLVSYYIFSS